MIESKPDFVYINPKKQVRITIPKMDGEVKVVTKPDLPLDAMLVYDTGGFKQFKAVINFFVEGIHTEEPVTSFRPPMTLEAGGGEDDQVLTYLDLREKKWIIFEDQEFEFEDQEKKKKKVKVKIRKWAADPQVAWGY